MCCRQHFTKCLKSLLMQQVSKLSVFLRESGDFLHGRQRSIIYELLFTVAVNLDIFTFNILYSIKNIGVNGEIS